MARPRKSFEERTVVRPTTSGRWEVDWLDPVTGQRRRPAFKTRIDAERARLGIIELHGRTAAGRPAATVDAVVGDYLRWRGSPLGRGKGGRRPGLRTCQIDGASARCLPAWLLAMPAAEVTPRHVERALTDMLGAPGRSHGSTRSPATVEKALGLLRRAYNRGLHLGDLTANPAATVAGPGAEVVRKPRVLTVAEVRTLLAALPLWARAPRIAGVTTPLATRRRTAAAVALLLTVGPRDGEVRALRVEDINLPGMVVTIRRHEDQATGGVIDGAKGKPHASRDVPLLALVAPYVAAVMRERPAVDAGWLLTTSAGTRVQYANLRRDLDALLAHVGISGTVSPHDLRHSAATTLMLAGVPAAVAAGILGHTVRTMQTIYQHLNDGGMDAATGALTGFLDALLGDATSCDAVATE
jgi:integrase/recombinase XerD